MQFRRGFVHESTYLDVPTVHIHNVCIAVYLPTCCVNGLRNYSTHRERGNRCVIKRHTVGCVLGLN